MHIISNKSLSNEFCTFVVQHFKECYNLHILGKFVDTRISVFGAFYGCEKYKCNPSYFDFKLLLNVPCLILMRFCIFNFWMNIQGEHLLLVISKR